MADREIGVGLIGFGLGGRVFHAPFANAVNGLRLTAVLQRQGEESARAYPAAQIVRTLDDMLANKAIELVVVTTPNATHVELAKQALEAGKHVVIDKPFATTSEEALGLSQLASSKGLLAVPFHNRRWDGDFLTVKKLIVEQALGRLVSFESHFDRFRPIPRGGVWQEAENPANGMLFDLGPHLVDQALALFGLPDTIVASVRSDRDGSEIEDAFDITLSYPGANGKGLLVHCRTSYLACDNSPRFLLHGTRGSFRKHGLDPQETAVVGGATVPKLGSPDVWLQEDEPAWGTLTVAPNPAAPARLVESRVKTEIGDYRGFYANVRDAILGTAPLALTAEDGYRVIRLLELARQSSAEGRRLKVEL
ncbi:MAG: Gfo/Idh/MocA family oxidoreductase [Ancalomicrobiaceae bacterium]|nr:Gfo/Idh/MocA family oxidoreductase [Ancalomicrobiaceae bacterium]